VVSVRPVALVLAMLALIVSFVFVQLPYSARGSSQHSAPIPSLLNGCNEDGGDAVAIGKSEPGAQGRCIGQAWVRLGIGSCGVVASAVAMVVVSWPSRRLTARRRRQPATS
jgi:hypothetical protein